MRNRELVHLVSENSDYNKPMSGKRLREALAGTTAVLGREAHDAVFHDRDTLQELQSALSKIIGHDGTMLLMQRLQKALE